MYSLSFVFFLLSAWDLYKIIRIKLLHERYDNDSLKLLQKIQLDANIGFHCANTHTHVNKSNNESDRILWDPTIRRKTYRNPGDDPRDGSVVLDPIGSHSKIRWDMIIGKHCILVG
jgi:hypothetical protein